MDRLDYEGKELKYGNELIDQFDPGGIE